MAARPKTAKAKARTAALGEYARKRDFDRSARFAAVPFVLPQPFPIATVGAARAYLWLKDSNPLVLRGAADADSAMPTLLL